MRFKRNLRNRRPLMRQRRISETKSAISLRWDQIVTEMSALGAELERFRATLVNDRQLKQAVSCLRIYD